MPPLPTPANDDCPRVALLDANVLFAPRLRDLMIHLHMARLIHVHWTQEIEREWTSNVIAKGHADPVALRRCLEGMRQAVPGWEVSSYERYQSRFESVHVKDRHVAAAAFKLASEHWPGKVIGLITKNLRDFPAKAFSATPIRRIAPGPYLDRLYTGAPKAVLTVVEVCRQKLRRPPADLQTYASILRAHHCKVLACAVAQPGQVSLC